MSHQSAHIKAIDIKAIVFRIHAIYKHLLHKETLIPHPHRYAANPGHTSTHACVGVSCLCVCVSLCVRVCVCVCHYEWSFCPQHSHQTTLHT